jgi:hypothetical protein
VIGVIVKLLTGGLLDKVLGLYDSFLNKQITEIEFRAKIEVARIEAEKAAEAEFSKMAAAIAESTQSTVRASLVIQRAYAAVMFLQLAVLSWYQIGAPAFQVITGTPWPHPGIVIEWSYALLAVTLGAGPFVLKR